MTQAKRYALGMEPISGAQLRQWLDYWRITPVDLARELGVSRQRVDQYLHAERLSAYVMARLEPVMDKLYKAAKCRAAAAGHVTHPLTGHSGPMGADILSAPRRSASGGARGALPVPPGANLSEEVG